MRFIDDYLAYLLARASHLVSGGFHAELARRGIPVPVWRVLATLSDGDALTIGALAKRVLMKQPTLTKCIDRMEAEGLVRRLECTADRRKVRVAITDRGREMVGGLVSAAQDHERRVLAGLGDEGRQLKKDLRRLIRDLAGEGSPAGDMEECDPHGDEQRRGETRPTEGLVQ